MSERPLSHEEKARTALLLDLYNGFGTDEELRQKAELLKGLELYMVAMERLNAYR